jgi:hypothetical protein
MRFFGFTCLDLAVKITGHYGASYKITCQITCPNFQEITCQNSKNITCPNFQQKLNIFHSGIFKKKIEISLKSLEPSKLQDITEHPMKLPANCSTQPS